MKDTAIRIPKGRPLLIVNEDNDHYFKLSSELMTEQALKDFVDGIADGGHVTHIFFCPFGQRPSYASDVCEPIWAGMEDPDINNRTHNIWCVNAKLLHDRGIDPYKVWIARSREKGVSPWLSIRMNDVHNITSRNFFRTCNFWREHPELRRNTEECDPNVWWEEYAFDYSKEPVRQFHFAIFKELVDRYAPDGVELDWMRFRRHLTPGREREQAHVITDFIRQCREYATEAAKRCGHPISLSVRVPTLPEMAYALGFSPVEWAAEGIVDLIVATNVFNSNDFNIPIDEWNRMIGDVAPDVPILPGATDRIGSSPEVLPYPMGIEYFRAWGNIMYSKGAKGLYLFNSTYLAKASRDEMYGEGMDPGRLAKTRRCFPVSYNDCSCTHDMADVQLPCITSKDNTLRVNIGSVGADSSVTLLLGFQECSAAVPAECVSLNGVACKEAPVPYDTPQRLCGSGICRSALTYRFPSSAAKEGVNLVKITKCDATPAIISWCEIIVE
ncbi:MAG: hypothetical protein J5833_01025 [Victivallales bacterium]|nr:hypothetical protein [Victivallales bacterium]